MGWRSGILIGFACGLVAGTTATIVLMLREIGW